LVGMPFYQIFKFVRTPGRLRKVKKVRAAAFGVAATALVGGLLLIPTPLRIQGSMVLKLAKPEEVYAETE
jgi:putative peptide zinc metalloprotease protein